MSDNQRPLPTLGLIQGAKLLRINPSTLRERAAAGDIPGAKIGRAWSSPGHLTGFAGNNRKKT